MEKAICPRCKKKQFKWSYTNEMYLTYNSLSGKLLYPTKSEEIITSDKTITVFSCDCGWVVGMSVVDSDADCSLLTNDEFKKVDWDNPINIHKISE